MSELGKELTDLKREVVESRNQSIKTDNQVKNLTLDVKGFENRFDDIEKKFRLATLGSYLVFSLVFGVASYFIASARISVLKTDYEQQKQAAEALKNDYQVKLEKGLAAEKKRGELAQRVTHARDRALTFLKAMDGKDKNSAMKAVIGLDTRLLSPLEQRLMEKKLRDFGQEAASEQYRKGRDLRGKNKDSAVEALKISLALEDKGRYSNAARYLLGTTLRELGQYRGAVEVFLKIEKLESDRSVLDEVSYWKGFSLMKLGELSEARSILTKLAEAGGRHAQAAKSQLAVLGVQTSDGSTEAGASNQ